MDQQENDYFVSYENIKVHEVMLKDYARMSAYENAIQENKEKFIDQVILDVGAGTGILSLMCARVGAKKVYAVEGSSYLSSLCSQVVKDNNFENIIEVYQGDIEKIDIPEKVDVIISEFMGHYLLHEGMLESVLSARKYLKEGGLMFPEKCQIYAAFCEIPELFKFWRNVSDFNFSAVGLSYRNTLANKPHIMNIDHRNVLSKSSIVATICLYDTHPSELKLIENDVFTIAKEDGVVQGLCIWFDVFFPGGSALSTSPSKPVTHWKQTIIPFPEEYFIEKNEALVCKLSFVNNDKRKYTISVELKDANDMEHPIPCSCILMKCVVGKAYYESLLGDK